MQNNMQPISPEIAELVEILRKLPPSKIHEQYLRDKAANKICRCPETGKTFHISENKPITDSMGFQYVNTFHPSLKKVLKDLAIFVCARCRDTVMFVEPSVDADGFRVEKGAVLHLPFCPRCNPALLNKNDPNHVAGVVPLEKQLFLKHSGSRKTKIYSSPTL